MVVTFHLLLDELGDSTTQVLGALEHQTEGLKPPPTNGDINGESACDWMDLASRYIATKNHKKSAISRHEMVKKIWRRL